MTIENFYALHEGTAPLYEREAGSDELLEDYDEPGVFLYQDVAVHRVLLGTLNISSGKLSAEDPFVMPGDPAIFNVEPGAYSVYATVADVSDNQDQSEYRECYVTIAISDKENVKLSSLPQSGNNRRNEESFYHVGVDAGLVSFYDTDAITSYLAEKGHKSLSNELQKAKIRTPEVGYGEFSPKVAQQGNLIFCNSGWGDGYYPVLQTTDTNGELTGIHIDLGVVGKPERRKGLPWDR
jgi:hypothetical protein